MQRRVVVTGMGAVSPLGLDVPALWAGIREARSGIAPITLFDTSALETRFAGEVRGFDPTNFMEKKEARRTDRFVQLAVAATREALAASGVQITPAIANAVGVYIGSGIGGLETLTTQHEVLLNRGPGRVSPFLVPAMITNMAAGQISILTGARGPSVCITSACASSAHAIGEAAEAIRRGWAKVMLAGGSEAPLTLLGVAGFNASKALSTRNDSPATASRPFDATRDGFVMAEGGAMLVLEELTFALERGAPILAEVVGYGMSSDAHHITQPPQDGEGAARAMQMALRSANLEPADVDYINAHGTSTPVGDIAETNAIKYVFGDHARTLAVSSSKSQLGHMLGGAGAIEAIVCILAMQYHVLPPTINLHEPDPQCDLDYVPNAARPGQVDVALSNSFGFGGHNVSLIVRRYTPTRTG
ncbi:MAG: beta-ketoacyl-ACP synthase II [Chloroflexaceae bacterium]|nr:beta-ketoacyl-ACP synthase II [Chloroflexaceae bacterium]